jgi:F-type H+-transporting ATPase subunit b
MAQLAPLGINLGLLFAQIAAFLIIVLILWAALYRPMTNMLKQRSERIAEGLNNARRAEEALASAEADRQKILDEARAEALRITAEARTRAEEAAAKIKADAQGEAKRIGEQARADANTEKERVMVDVRDQIVSLSLAAANHLIGKNLDEKKQRAYVQEFFTGLPKEAKKLNGAMTVITAVALKVEEQKLFKKELGAKEITFKVDPSILGGVIVRAGGEQIDGSFVNQLAGMRTSLS